MKKRHSDFQLAAGGHTLGSKNIIRYVAHYQLYTKNDGIIDAIFFNKCLAMRFLDKQG